MRHKWLLFLTCVGVILVQATFANPAKESTENEEQEISTTQNPMFHRQGTSEENEETISSNGNTEKNLTGTSDQVTIAENNRTSKSRKFHTVRTKTTKRPSSICAVSMINYDCMLKDLHLKLNEDKDFGLDWTNNLQKNITFTDSRLQYLPKKLFDAFPQMELLNAANLQIEEIENLAFNNAGNLIWLYLQRNLISSIKTFKGVPLLIYLDLSYNRINQINIDAFERNKQLKRLIMNDNQILELPSFKTIENLEIVNLSKNKLQTISDNQFRENDMLQSLDASYNQLSQFNLENLNNKQHLHSIDVSYNNLESLYIPQYTQHLNAKNNSIHDITANRCTLINLYLSHNQITDISSVQNCRELIILDLSYNKLQSFNLFDFMPKLQNLNVSHNHLFEINFQRKIHPLQILDLSYNRISFGPVSKFEQMKTLMLNNNEFIEFKFDNLISLAYITLNNNEWSCTKIEQIMDQKNVFIGDRSETCLSPNTRAHNGICCRDYKRAYNDRLKEILRKINLHENLNKNDLKTCKQTKPFNSVNPPLREQIVTGDSVNKQIYQEIENENKKIENVLDEIAVEKSELATLKRGYQNYTKIIEGLRRFYGVTKEGLISSHLTLNRTVQYTQERNSLNKDLLARRTQENEETNARLKSFHIQKKKLNDDYEELKTLLSDLKKKESTLKKDRQKLEKDANKNSPSLHGSG